MLGLFVFLIVVVINNLFAGGGACLSQKGRGRAAVGCVGVFLT